MGDDPKESDSGKPIRFVYFDDESGMFEVDPTAIDLLQQIKGPVAAVSVCGPARQGKSFLLNQLLGRRTGFQVGSTHQPCTKGLWMWSIALKKTAVDGTEYDLLLFDSGGTGAYGQTGVSSTQIFSLAVLLSSLFVYNQVGVIDEAALVHLSLVTEMTKHIHHRASEGKDLISELKHFSPVFVWLLRDFYLDLVENNIKINPHDYLEVALRPVQGSRNNVAARNQVFVDRKIEKVALGSKIRDSIRAVFPSRECFTLVRPLKDETDLQHPDRVPLDEYQPEFRSGLVAFANFVYLRTRPKQVGDTLMTGPMLAGVTKSFLDALNNSAAPTISFSWQVCSRDSVVETDLQCFNAIRSMEKKLQEACLATNARLENVVMVLENLLSEYEESVHGPTKWQKLSSFLQKSVQGPILHHAQKLIDEASLEKSSLMLKCRSFEDKIELLHRQLESSEKSKNKYLKCYEDAITDFRKISDQYKSRIIDLESKLSVLEERCSRSLEMLDSAKWEALDWERKYEEILTTTGSASDQANASTAFKSGISEAKSRAAAAAAEHSRLALKEANEWKEKYDISINEAKAATEKEAKAICEAESRAAAAAEQSRLALREANVWKEKYDSFINEAKAAREKEAKAICDAEARAAAAAEQSCLALKEATEWKEKFDISINEAKAAREKEAKAICDAEARAAAAAEQSRLALKEANEWKEKYEISINEAKAASEKEVKAICDAEARAAAAAEQSRLALKEANEWKEKYDISTNEAKAAREMEAEAICEVEARATTASEQSRLALKEANEWKEKYEISINEAKAAREKEAEEAKLREEDLIATFTSSLAEKDEEIKDKVDKLEENDKRLSNLTFELKTAETKIKNYDLELSASKLQVKELTEKYEFVKGATQSMEREAQTLTEDRIQLEQYLSELEGCEVAKQEAKVTKEFVESAQSEVPTAQNKKHSSCQLTVDGLAQTRISHGQTQSLEREKMDVTGEVKRSVVSEGYAKTKIAILEAMVRERDQEIEQLKKKCEQCANTVQIFESEFNHATDVEAKDLEKEPFLRLETMQERLNIFQQEQIPEHSYIEWGTSPETFSGRKHSRQEVPDENLYSVKLETPEEMAREMKKPSSSSTLQKCSTAEVGSMHNADEDSYQKAASVDYTKLTVMKLRQELHEHGFGEELQKLRYPKKRDIVALYRKLVLKK